MGASKNTTDGGGSGVVPKGANSANWWENADWKGSTNGNLTDVGSNGGPSAYGTYDQTGNVNEWANVTSTTRANAVGGSFKDDLRIIHKNFGRGQLPIATRSPDIGFRICSDDNYLELPNFVTVASGGGSVNYDYMICKYTVTNCDYIKFLRSMSAFDEDASNNYINVIWNPYMGGANTSNGIGIDGGGTNFYGGIKKTGQGVAPAGEQCGYWLREDLIVSSIPGESSSVSGGLHFKKKPVVFVNFIMAAKYCNWLHHGMPKPTNQSVWANYLKTGAYDLTSYSLTDSTSVPPTKSPGAKYWIPTLDEWNKAGFYKGGGTNTGYWLWATQTGTTNLTLAPTWVSCDEFGVGPESSSYSCDIPSINCP